jgi:Lamin Tail Domain
VSWPPVGRQLLRLISAGAGTLSVCCAAMVAACPFLWGIQLRRRIAFIVASALLALVVPLAANAQAAAWPIQLGRIYYNSPGSDTGSNTSLNAEYFTIKNTGSTRVNVTGYTVRDRAGHTYTVGAYSLAPGQYVRVHTGKGTNTAVHKYWNRSWYVWNNNGDKAELRDAGGTLRDSCEWPGGGSYKQC